jgi:transposase
VTTDALPDDIAALKAMLLAERASYRAEIEKLRHTIARLRHEQYGQSAERRALLDQLELQLGELEENQAQAEAAEEIAAPQSVTVEAVTRRKPARRPLPEHLPRERVVYPVPAACPCCGGALHKLGEDVTETLELVPRQWKVIQHVREKYSCRSCEKITQPPAPSHPIARGRAGPGLLAHVLFAKYGLHLPLHRQSRTYAREGIELDVSTLADWVGASAATLMPLVETIRAHVFAGQRLHADDTPVPVLDTGQTRTGRLWTYVRDDRPFAGRAPPAAAYFYSPDRSGAHPQAHLHGWSGLMQADAYAGFNRLYEPIRKPAPIVEVACWAHARRKFFDLARLTKAPIALEAVSRIDALFSIERDINGLSSDERRRVRHERSRPLVDALGTWLRQQYQMLSPNSQVAKAIAYSLNCWDALLRFLDDGRLCLSNNAAERALRGIAVGRHNWTFAGSDEGGRRAAAIYTLIETAKLSDVDPLAWLADVLARLQDHPAKRIDELLPWNWKRRPCTRLPPDQRHSPRPSPDAYHPTAAHGGTAESANRRAFPNRCEAVILENAEQALCCDRCLGGIAEGIVDIGHTVDNRSTIDVAMTVNVDCRTDPPKLALQHCGPQHGIEVAMPFGNMLWHHIYAGQKMREGDDRSISRCRQGLVHRKETRCDLACTVLRRPTAGEVIRPLFLQVGVWRAERVIVPAEQRYDGKLRRVQRLCGHAALLRQGAYLVEFLE